MSVRMSEEQIGNYINALRECRGLERKAAKRAGIMLELVRAERDVNDEFRQFEEGVREEIGEWIHEEVMRRAIDGRDENVWYKGAIVGTEKKVSDTLLLALAKAHVKEFNDKVVLQSDNGPLKVEIKAFDNVNKD